MQTPHGKRSKTAKEAEEKQQKSKETLVTRTEEMTQKIGRPIQQVAHWIPMDATSATTDSGRQDTGLFPNHMHLPASRTP